MCAPRWRPAAAPTRPGGPAPVAADPATAGPATARERQTSVCRNVWGTVIRTAGQLQSRRDCSGLYGRSRLAAAAAPGWVCGWGQTPGDLPRVLCSGSAAELSGIGDHLPLPSLLGSAGSAAAATGAVGPATLGPPFAVAGTVLG